jgi:hypothetical protein
MPTSSNERKTIMRQSRSIPALIWTLAVLTGASVLLAQGDGRRAGPAPVFKGGGNRSSGRRPPPAPISLTSDAIKSLVGATPGAVFVKLTPRDPSVVNRGALVFVNPALVEGGEDYAMWGPSSGNVSLTGSEGHLALWLRPVAGKKYLIDCAVQSSTPNAVFNVTGPSGAAPIQVAATGVGQHLTFVLEASDSQWQGFQINGGGSKNKAGLGTSMEWTFYSCEVINL